MLLSIVYATHLPFSFNYIPDTHFQQALSALHSLHAIVEFVDPHAKHTPELSKVYPNEHMLQSTSWVFVLNWQTSQLFGHESHTLYGNVVLVLSALIQYPGPQSKHPELGLHPKHPSPQVLHVPETDRKQPVSHERHSKVDSQVLHGDGQG